jgi:hypothetical protein
MSVTPAVPQPLATGPDEVKCSVIVIQANPTNAGEVYVGYSDISATKCIKLVPDKAIEISVDDTTADEDMVFFDLRDVYIDGNVAGDKVNIMIGDMVSVKY